MQTFFCFVNRVNPLPESLLAYVWDYGSLSDKDEETYIKSIVTTQLPVLQEKDRLLVVELFIVSQLCIFFLLLRLF